MAISKEEKAVRDALAKFEKDYAASTAAVSAMNQGSITPAKNIDEARASLSQIKDPKLKAELQKLYTGLDVQSQRLETQAKSLGYQVNPNTGALTPIVATQQQQQQSQQPILTAEQLLAQQNAKLAAEQALQNRQSAFDLLRAQFAQYGLEALVTPLQGLIQENVSPSEFAIRLRQTEPYKKRFAANAARIGKGLRALSEAEYLSLEDGYQSIMRNYGLPASYYAKGDLGRQEGFEKLISGDVSAAELEDRIATAQNRVINAPPQVKDALKQFYPDINNSDILAYTLDPEKGLADIKRKVTAAEIGGAAIGAGLATDVTRAEELAKFGVTAATARQGYQAAVPLIERGSQLAGFYDESPYTQRTAEEELFGLTYAPEATAKRKRLTALEEAQFAGRAGMTGGALSRERAGSF